MYFPITRLSSGTPFFCRFSSLEQPTTQKRIKVFLEDMFGRSKQKEKTCRKERVASWGTSFEKVLEDPIGLKTFTEFLKREFSAENIIFWIACKQYSTLNDKIQRTKLAKEIYDLHLRPGATEAVNINSHTRQCVRNKLLDPPLDIFAQAEKEIFILMKFDCYQRFLKSDVYNDSLNAEKLGKPMPCNFLSTNTKSPSRTRFRSKSQDRFQHNKKTNSANYTIAKELGSSNSDTLPSTRRSYMSTRKGEIDALWTKLQPRLDDQRGTELKFDMPEFLCTEEAPSIS